MTVVLGKIIPPPKMATLKYLEPNESVSLRVEEILQI